MKLKPCACAHPVTDHRPASAPVAGCQECACDRYSPDLTTPTDGTPASVATPAPAPAVATPAPPAALVAPAPPAAVVTDSPAPDLPGYPGGRTRQAWEDAWLSLGDGRWRYQMDLAQEIAPRHGLTPQAVANVLRAATSSGVLEKVRHGARTVSVHRPGTTRVVEIQPET